MKTRQSPGRAERARTPARPFFTQSAVHGRLTEGDPPFFQPRPSLRLSPAQGAMIQREEGEGAEAKKPEEEKDPLTEGLKTVGGKLLEKPEFKAWYEPKLKLVGEELWGRQPTEVKVALAGYAGLNLALGALAFGASPELRSGLSGTDIGKPLGWIPYSPIESFKYTLPEAGKSAYGFSAGFTLNPYLEALRKRYPEVPLTALTFGLETAYEPGGGLSLTGGKFGLEFFGGGLKAEGKSFTELSPYPMMLPGATPFEPPSMLMQGVPGMPPLKTGPGFQFMLSADVFKLIDQVTR